MCSAFEPKTWPFPLSLLPKEAHLVGGSVRDQLLRRDASYLDLDFVLPSRAVETASDLAKACAAGFVVLDEERQIARVVFDRLTVDFAQQQGESLEADLRRRDFTINAIAYHPLTQTFVDPLDGKTDLANKTIRMVSAQNLAADPLRLMRGYRQAAQLKFTIEPRTQQTIHQLASKLKKASIERVRSELDALLSEQDSTSQLSSILEHQLLEFCLPHFNRNSLERLSSINQAVDWLEATRPRYIELLQQWIKPTPAGFHRSWIKATRLSCLVGPEVAIAQRELTSLSYSKSETQVVLTLLKAAPTIEQLKYRGLKRSEQFFLFKLAGKHFLAVALLALAQGIELERLEPMIVRFLDPTDAIAHPKTLVTGTEIMRQCNLSPGPELGRLLQSIEQEQAAGTLSTPAEAICWIKSQYRSQDS